MRGRRRQNNIQSKRRLQNKAVQSKVKNKEIKAPMMICLILGIAIGWFTEFDIKSFIENISKYQISIVKEGKEEHPINNELSLNDGNLNKEQDEESDAKEVASNKIVKGETSNTKQEPQQAKEESPKKIKQDNINKAKQAIINNCGSEWSGVVYATEAAHPTQGGNYYIFNVGPDGMGDMQFYVDTDTYKVYEYSVDGYFGEYRNGNSNVFTYDMAVISLENYLGWDEDRRFSLVEEKSDGFIIRTAFETEGGSGTGETYYVTMESIDIYTGY